MRARVAVVSLLAVLIAIPVLRVGWHVSAQSSPAPFVCALTPNPEAGEYRELGEKAERYELSGVDCPVMGDLVIYKNGTDQANELMLSASPFLPRQRVGLLTIRGR